jgi:hypothetical protein
MMEEQLWIYLLKGDDDLTEEAVEGETSEDAETRKRKRNLFMELAKATRNREFTGEDGKSFLHHAVELADEPIHAELLHRDFNLEPKDSEHYTPLHRAILAGPHCCIPAWIR